MCSPVAASVHRSYSLQQNQQQMFFPQQQQLQQHNMVPYSQQHQQQLLQNQPVNLDTSFSDSEPPLVDDHVG